MMMCYGFSGSLQSGWQVKKLKASFAYSAIIAGTVRHASHSFGSGVVVAETVVRVIFRTSPIVPELPAPDLIIKNGRLEKWPRQLRCTRIRGDPVGLARVNKGCMARATTMTGEQIAVGRERRIVEEDRARKGTMEIPLSPTRRKGNIAFGSKRSRIVGKTSYMIEYEAPPLDVYGGKAAKGSPMASKGTSNHGAQAFGLGENSKTMYAESFLDFGEAYKQKTKPIESAKTVHIATKGQSNASYATSYVESYPVRPIEAKIATRKTQKKLETDGKLGPVFTMYKEDYGNPRDHESYDTMSASKRLPIFVQKDKKKVEMQPYGPLCMSSMQESFQPPPKSAFLKQTTQSRQALSRTKQELRPRSRGDRTGMSMDLEARPEGGARRPTTGVISDRVSAPSLETG
eukprot:765526-Hanusia_phi.AAC.1